MGSQKESESARKRLIRIFSFPNDENVLFRVSACSAVAITAFDINDISANSGPLLAGNRYIFYGFFRIILLCGDYLIVIIKGIASFGLICGLEQRLQQQFVELGIDIERMFYPCWTCEFFYGGGKLPDIAKNGVCTAHNHTTD